MHVDSAESKTSRGSMVPLESDERSDASKGPRETNTLQHRQSYLLRLASLNPGANRAAMAPVPSSDGPVNGTASFVRESSSRVSGVIDPSRCRCSSALGRLRSQVSGFADRVLAGESVEAVGAMTRAIPTIVIARMIGISPEDEPDFTRWSDGIAGIAGGRVDDSPEARELARVGRESTQALHDYVGQRIDAGSPDDGSLLADLMASPAAADMDRGEMLASVTQLVFAGNETTAKLMASTLHAFAEHPEQWQLLRERRDLIPAAVEEVNRWSSVAQSNWKESHDGASVDGVTLLDGKGVLLLMAMSNRDATRWDDPKTFDITRPLKPHLNFGIGAHACLGANLARLEVQVMLAELLDRLPTFSATHVDWGHEWVVRGPVRIHVHAG